MLIIWLMQYSMMLFHHLSLRKSKQETSVNFVFLSFCCASLIIPRTVLFGFSLSSRNPIADERICDTVAPAYLFIFLSFFQLILFYLY
jgi:hypothetical protein